MTDEYNDGWMDGLQMGELSHSGLLIIAVLCESVLLLYWRAETLEVRPLSLACVVPSPSWPFASHTSYLTSPLRSSTFGKDPSSSTYEQKPPAFPRSSPCPSCPPLQSLDCSMRACQLERGTSCLTRPCAQSLQAAVSSGHAAGSRSPSAEARLSPAFRPQTQRELLMSSSFGKSTSVGGTVSAASLGSGDKWDLLV